MGQLEFGGGIQLDDTSAPDGVITPGVLSLIAKAHAGRSTAPEVPATTRPQDMAKTNPAQLGCPTGRSGASRRRWPTRRLEGLLIPGRYDIAPAVGRRRAALRAHRVGGPDRRHRAALRRGEDGDVAV